MPKNSPKDEPDWWRITEWCCKGKQKIAFDVRLTPVNTGDGVMVGFSGEMTRTLTSVCMHNKERCGACKRVWPDEDSWSVEGEVTGSYNDAHTRDGWNVNGTSFLQIELPCCDTTHRPSGCPPAVKKEKFKVSGAVAGPLYSDQWMGVDRNMVNRVAHALLAEYGVGGTQPPAFLACCRDTGDPPPPT